MAKYREIKGVTIQTLDSDPVLNVGSWASGNSMNVARYMFGGNGTQTAALASGGVTPAGLKQWNESEEYDGSSWTEE